MAHHRNLMLRRPPEVATRTQEAMQGQSSRDAFMSAMEFFQRFPDHESCIAHLETIRWVVLSGTSALRANARRAEGTRAGRWRQP